jgi:hypothetical protein
MHLPDRSRETPVKLRVAGLAKIAESQKVRLPDVVIDEVGWKPGDTVLVEVIDGDRVILSRRSADIVDLFAGALTDLYPDPDDTRRFLDEGRGYDGADPDAEP